MVTAVVVGCGDRATVYCHEAYKNQLGLKIVAAVDPDEVRLKYMREQFGVSEDMCFKSIAPALKMGRIADCVINGTMDQQHVKTTVPFLEQKYHMLLEKPVAPNRASLLKIADAARRNGCKLVVCHVLRYAPFYRKAKELVLSGAIGEIVHIETTERVGVAHSSVSYIRGKWNSEKACGSSMLLAKCCHDLDLLCWFMHGIDPVAVSSFGGRDFIVPEKAPKEAGTRCLVDCPLTKECQFSAQPIYLDNDFLPWYPWQCTGKNYQDVSPEEKRKSLETYNPHGVCAYKAGADIVDHQSLMIRFESGATATHSMLSASMRPGRSLFIQGTAGEIEGWAGDGHIVLRKFNPKNVEYTESRFDFNETEGETGGHFGGDRGLMQDFIGVISGGKPSYSYTCIEDSVMGHLCVYAADRAMKTGTIRKISLK